jgi:hypothetical protein
MDRLLSATKPLGVLTMFLSQEELIELTGKRQRAAQVRVLRFMGIGHKIRPDGSVAVLLEHVKIEMGMSQDAVKANKEWTPPWNRHV